MFIDFYISNFILNLSKKLLDIQKLMPDCIILKKTGINKIVDVRKLI